MRIIISNLQADIYQFIATMPILPAEAQNICAKTFFLNIFEKK